MNPLKSVSSIMLLLSMSLVGCGGGSGGGSANAPGSGGSPPPSSAPPQSEAESVTAIGPITRFGSVIVNGTRYDTDRAEVLINGLPAAVEELELGQVIRVEGRIEDASIVADRVEYDANVVGEIDEIDTAAGEIVVLGQRIRAATGAAVTFDVLDMDVLGIGTIIEVSGLPSVDGVIDATYIAIHDGADDLLLMGAVENLDESASTFDIGTQHVSYAEASILDTFSGELENGTTVRVRGHLDSDDVLIADEVVVLGPKHLGDPGDHVDFLGVVTRFGSDEDFDVNGHPVTTTGDTRFLAGSAEDLGLRTIVRVVGDIDDSGTVVASEIEFESLPDAGVAGPVENVDTDAGTLTILGVDVSVTDDTRFRDRSEASAESIGLSDIRIGDYVRAVGSESTEDGGTIEAVDVTRIESRNFVLALGTIDSVDRPEFSLLDISIRTTDRTVFFGGPTNRIVGPDTFFDQALNESALVKGTWDNAVLTAAGATLLPATPQEPPGNGSGGGDGGGDGSGDGDGGPDDGGSGNGGGSDDPGQGGPDQGSDELTTLDYDLSGFDRVDVSVAFEAHIDRGGSHSVRVTIEEFAAHAVRVDTRNGTLVVSLDTDALNDATVHPTVYVTMPSLAAAQFSSAVAARVSGFSGGSLSVSLRSAASADLRSLDYDSLQLEAEDASSVSGNGSSFDNVDASVRKASKLNFGNVSPIGSADIVAGEISEAVVNMASGGRLSGSAEALSVIRYYGDNVSENVSVDSTSRVERAGATR